MLVINACQRGSCGWCRKRVETRDLLLIMFRFITRISDCPNASALINRWLSCLYSPENSKLYACSVNIKCLEIVTNKLPIYLGVDIYTKKKNIFCPFSEMYFFTCFVHRLTKNVSFDYPMAQFWDFVVWHIRNCMYVIITSGLINRWHSFHSSDNSKLYACYNYVSFD